MTDGDAHVVSRAGNVPEKASRPPLEHQIETVVGGNDVLADEAKRPFIAKYQRAAAIGAAVAAVRHIEERWCVDATGSGGRP